MASIEKDELLLTQLILMFQTAAMQHMGKLKNPMTDNVDRDLQQAQISIDMIEMLHNKMKANLSQQEDRMMTEVLRELKLNYVDEIAKEQKPQSSSPSAPQ